MMFSFALKRRAQRIRAAWLRAIGRGGRSPSRPAESGPVLIGSSEELIDLLEQAALR